MTPDARLEVIEIGRAIIARESSGSAYREEGVDLLAYTRLVRERLVTSPRERRVGDDRLLRAEIEVWAERAPACTPAVAVASLEQILFPRHEDRPSPPVQVPKVGDGAAIVAALVAIGAVVVAGAISTEGGSTFEFQVPSIAKSPPKGAAHAVGLAPVALPVSEAAHCIDARDYECVRRELLPRVDSLSADDKRALRIACAALADYGCVLRIER